MKILLSGFWGHMGQTVVELAASGCRGAEIVAGVDLNAGERAHGRIPCAPDFDSAACAVDCVVDFSHHACTAALTGFAMKHSLPLVIATTGQTPEDLSLIREAARSIPLFFAANYSLGIALLIELAKKTAAAMPDAEIEIVEAHHDRKLDAPSGTAIAIAAAISEVRPASRVVAGRNGQQRRAPQEIGIHSIRMGNIVGMHEVMIGTPNQTITLKHEAHSRALFAEGALAAAEFVCRQAPGLYGMNDLVAF